MVQTVIFEDHTLYRLGIKSALENIPNIQVAGEVCCETSLFKLLAQTPVNLILMGVNIPDRTDYDRIAKRIRCDYPAIKIIAVVDEDNTRAIQSIKNVGIEGCLGKRAASSKALAKMIREVVAKEENIKKSR